MTVRGWGSEVRCEMEGGRKGVTVGGRGSEVTNPVSGGLRDLKRGGLGLLQLVQRHVHTGQGHVHTMRQRYCTT